MEIRDVEVPRIREDEVLIRVRAAGICGSDLHLYRGQHAFRRPPAVLGHELAGDIVQAGALVEDFQVGDRVTVEPHIPCGRCEYCREGAVNLCPNKTAPGTPGWIGSFVDYFNAPASVLHRLGDHVGYGEGTLIEPLAVAVHALRQVRAQSPRTLAILGAGSIGLMALLAARTMGYADIYCTDTAPYNLEAAASLGARGSFHAVEGDPVQAVLDATGGRGVDVVLVAAGAPDILDQASRMARRRGEIVLVAMITEQYPFYSYSYVFREQALYGAMTYRSDDFQEAARMVNGGLDLKPLITHTLPLDEAGRGLALLDQKKEGVIKVLVTPD